MNKVKFDRTVLLRALEIGGQCACESKTSLSMKQVRLSFKAGRMKVESCNELSSVRTFGECRDASGEFSLCIDFKQAFAYIKAISSNDVTFEQEGEALRIIHDDGETTVPCYPTSEFPEASKPDASLPSYTIDGALFRKWVNSAKSFVDNDDLRVILNGIHINASAGKMFFAASDSKTLIFEEVDYNEDADFNFILDSKAFPALLSNIKDCEVVTLTADDKTVFLSMPSAKMTVRKTIGNFPKVKSVIPKESTTEAVIDRERLLSALQRIKVSSSTANTRINFKFTDNMLSLIYEDQINGRLGKEQIEIECSGNMPLEIAFAIGNFEKCVNAFDSKRIRLGMTTNNKPVICTSADDGSPCDMKTIVTPMMWG